MQYIFPNNIFVSDKPIPKAILMERKANEYRQFRPDIRCEYLNLVVEFDGDAHYKDIEKDQYLISLGYKVVRIPFWVQLSKVNIEYYFNVKVDNGCEEHKSGFNSLNSDKVNLLNPNTPANFCTLGLKRFIDEYEVLPKNTQNEIIETLKQQQIINQVETVLPIKIENEKFQKFLR